MNCQWSSWARWGSCNKACGRGLRYRRRRIVRHAKNGGRKCTGSSRASTSCNGRNCGPKGIIKSMLKQLMHFEFISKLISIIFKAVKTYISDVSHLNVRVTVLVVMFLGCLETARNPAIGVILDPEVC